MALHDDRKEYVKGSLDDRWLEADPLTQFAEWLLEYRESGAEDATAFALSTASVDGEPDARIVLLKELRGRDLVFFYELRIEKGPRFSKKSPCSRVIFLAKP